MRDSQPHSLLCRRNYKSSPAARSSLARTTLRTHYVVRSAAALRALFPPNPIAIISRNRSLPFTLKLGTGINPGASYMGHVGWLRETSCTRGCSRKKSNFWSAVDWAPRAGWLRWWLNIPIILSYTCVTHAIGFTHDTEFTHTTRFTHVSDILNGLNGLQAEFKCVLQKLLEAVGWLDDLHYVKSLLEQLERATKLHIMQFTHNTQHEACYSVN
jgi:hypothetical protein